MPRFLTLAESLWKIFQYGMSSKQGSDWVASFQKNGFIILRNYLDREELELYQQGIKEAIALLEKESGLNAEGLIFHSNLFRLNQALAHGLCAEKIASVIETVANASVWIRWDQQITKMPGGVEFPWHRDNAYNKLRAEHFQCWIPLSSMTPENGALWLQPGSHLWEESEHLKKDNHWVADLSDADSICLEAEPGDLVLFSSKLFHKTGINQTDSPRVAYVVEYMKQRDFDPGVEAPYLFVEDHLPKWVPKHPERGRFWKPTKAVISGKDIDSKRKV